MVVAVSSTADARRDAPVRPALTPRETVSHARVRAPRPWTASLQRPAAKILVAGGLTLAGWLLGAALSGGTASAADRPACPEAPVVSTVDHAAKPFSHARHRKSQHQTGDDRCVAQPKADSAEPPPADETPADEAPAAEAPAEPETTKDSPATEEPAPATPDSASTATSAPEAPSTSPESPSAEEPATTKTAAEDSSEAPKATSASGNLLGNLVGGTLETVTGTTTKDTTGEPAATSSGGLLGGLVGSVLDVVGGTLTTVTDTVGTVTDTLTHTVVAPLTQPPAGHPGGPVLLPIDDILNPVLGGSSNAGGVTVTVPVVTTLVAPVPATAESAVPAAAVATTAAPQTSRSAVVHLVVRQARALPAVQEQPRDSGTHATGGGGDSTPGLPGGTTAPSAPAPTAAPGHDGSGGARHAFAVHTDDVTTTQLKLIGTSRDHEVDGAGREAALPTTSPD